MLIYKYYPLNFDKYFVFYFRIVNLIMFTFSLTFEKNQSLIKMQILKSGSDISDASPCLLGRCIGL